MAVDLERGARNPDEVEWISRTYHEQLCKMFTERGVNSLEFPLDEEGCEWLQPWEQLHPSVRDFARELTLRITNAMNDDIAAGTAPGVA